MDIAKTDEVATAVNLINQGEHAQAESYLRTKLNGGSPEQASLLYTLATLRLDTGKFDEAIHSFKRLSTENGEVNFPDFRTRYGHALQGTGRHDEALAQFDVAISQDPSNPEVICRKGISLFFLKRTDEALESIESALQIRSDLPYGWLFRGHIMRGRGNKPEALHCYERATAIRVDMVEALFNQAQLLAESNRASEAGVVFSKVLHYQPENVPALLGCGQQLQRLDKHHEALQPLAKALELAPNNPNILFAIGQSHGDMENFELARKNLESAVKLMPNNPAWHYTLGNLLRRMGHPEPAVNSYDRAIALHSDFIPALNNRGRVLQELNIHNQAVADFKKILELQNDYPSSDWHIGFSMLSSGMSREGLVYCEARLKTESYLGRTHPTLPLLKEQDVEGKKLLVQWEQRFGDIVQMARFIPAVEQMAEDCWWQVIVPLQGLLRRNFPTAKFVDIEATPPSAEHCIFYTSLPLVARCFDDGSIPSKDSYLEADKEQRDLWKARIGSQDGRLKVAVTWRGNADPPGRSIPVEMLAPVFSLDNIDFFSIQRDISPAERAFVENYKNFQDVTPEIVSFDDTASLLAAMDLCLTVDTAAAHLAGALGMPTWILLKYGPDWRWQQKRTDSPWYSSARLFRQPTPEDWDGVVAEIVAGLEQLAPS